MFYTYVLKSKIKNLLYNGHCENLDKRLKEHNSGKTKSIKHAIPFEIIYFETFETREGAINRERYFKTAAGRKYLKTKLAQLSEE